MFFVIVIIYWSDPMWQIITHFTVSVFGYI